MLRKLVALGVLAALAALPTPVDAVGIRLVIDGKAVNGPAPIMVGERAMIPLGAYAKELGLDKGWNAQMQTAWFSPKTSFLQFEANPTMWVRPGDPRVRVERSMVEDDTFNLDVAPQFCGWYTCVPARFAAEAFGWSYSWNDANQTIYIDRSKNPIPSDFYNVSKVKPTLYSWGFEVVPPADGWPMYPASLKEYRLQLSQLNGAIEQLHGWGGHPAYTVEVSAMDRLEMRVGSRVISHIEDDNWVRWMNEWEYDQYLVALESSKTRREIAGTAGGTIATTLFPEVKLPYVVAGGTAGFAGARVTMGDYIATAKYCKTAADKKAKSINEPFIVGMVYARDLTIWNWDIKGCYIHYVSDTSGEPHVGIISGNQVYYDGGGTYSE